MYETPVTSEAPGLSTVLQIEEARKPDAAGMCG